MLAHRISLYVIIAILHLFGLVLPVRDEASLAICYAWVRTLPHRAHASLIHVYTWSVARMSWIVKCSSRLPLARNTYARCVWRFTSSDACLHGATWLSPFDVVLAICRLSRCLHVLLEPRKPSDAWGFDGAKVCGFSRVQSSWSCVCQKQPKEPWLAEEEAGEHQKDTKWHGLPFLLWLAVGKALSISPSLLVLSLSLHVSARVEA